MVGKQINPDTQRFHALEMRPSRHLAMLQRMSVVGPGMGTQRLFNFIECDFRAFITICVHMHLNTGRSKGFEIVA